VFYPYRMTPCVVCSRKILLLRDGLADWARAFPDNSRSVVEICPSSVRVLSHHWLHSNVWQSTGVRQCACNSLTRCLYEDEVLLYFKYNYGPWEQSHFTWRVLNGPEFSTPRDALFYAASLAAGANLTRGESQTSSSSSSSAEDEPTWAIAQSLLRLDTPRT
jgi:hypothetical protein